MKSLPMNPRHLLPVLLVLVGCSEPVPRNMDTLVQEGYLFLDRETLKPYSGLVFELFADDTTKIHKRGQLTDGKQDGTWQMYAEDGVLLTRYTFSNGVEDGPFLHNWPNGSTGLAGYYSNGMREGPSEQFLPDGEPFESGSYSRGEKCGEWVEFGRTVTYPPCPNG